MKEKLRIVLGETQHMEIMGSGGCSKTATEDQ